MVPVNNVVVSITYIIQISCWWFIWSILRSLFVMNRTDCIVHWLIILENIKINWQNVLLIIRSIYSIMQTNEMFNYCCFVLKYNELIFRYMFRLLITVFILIIYHSLINTYSQIVFFNIIQISRYITLWFFIVEIYAYIFRCLFCTVK